MRHSEHHDAVLHYYTGFRGVHSICCVNMAKNIKLPDFAIFLRALDPTATTDSDSDTDSATDLDSVLAQLEDSDLDKSVPATPHRDYAEILEDIQESVKEFEQDNPTSTFGCALSDISSPSNTVYTPDSSCHTDSDLQAIDQVVIEPKPTGKQYIWHHSTPEDYESKAPTSLLDVTPPGSPIQINPDHNDAEIRKLLRCNPRSSVDLINHDGDDTPPPSLDGPFPTRNQECGPPPPLYATFSNVPTFFIPYHPVSYIIHISVYPKSATGTLYEKVAGNVCARCTLCDDQVFTVYKLDDRKGLDYIVRYLTSSLMVTIVMHNEVFKYKVDFKRIPIKVLTYDGKSLDYSY